MTYTNDNADRQAKERQMMRLAGLFQFKQSLLHTNQ